MNIGLLVSELEDKDVKKICIGASQAADDKGVSLVIMPGKYLASDNKDAKNPYDYQYSALFEYANTADFDALIIDIERIGRNATILKKESFLKKFDKVPVLTLTEQEGFTSVNEVKTDHEQLEQLGYEAVCDACFFAKEGKLPANEAQKSFSFVEKPESDAIKTLSEVGALLLNRKYGNEKAYGIFSEKAVSDGIKNFGIFLYDTKIRNNLKYNWILPEKISVKSTAICGKVDVFDEEKRIVDTDKIFSQFLKNKPMVLIAGDIFVGEHQLGIVVTEFSSKTLINHFFSSLVSIVTGVSRLSYLEKELLKTTEELYEVQEELARDDSVLDHIGDQDYLTGGLNRRGFFAKAYDLLKEEFKPGRYAIVAYIHMDSLKKINELYGHEEGDRAVRRIAEVLESVFKKSIYGRIRGDEFAVIEITDEEGKAENFRQEMSAQNASLLEESSRYMNHLQYSICEFSYEDNLSLREMLKETDDNLQKIKQMQ